MNPRLLSQPLPPMPAKGSAPRRLRTLGLAFLLAFFVVLLRGDAAHAEGTLDASPPSSEAPAAASTDDTDGKPTAEAGPAEVAGPAEDGPSADLVATTDTAVVEDSAVPVLPVEDKAGEPLPEAGETDAAVVPPATPEPALLTFEGVLEANSVTAQAHVAPAVNQCNADTYPTGAGWEASCVITIENTLGSDGSTGSRVTTTTCLAAAGVLPPAGCTTHVSTIGTLVTSVNQCNGILAGGSNVTCSVQVINNVPFGTPTTGVTVNQCVGSGQGGVSPGGPPTDCNPAGSSTTGATVTQCNGSANGGGAPERVQCAVTGGSTALPVTVNQCNGSTAAGSTVTCDVTYTNNFAAAVTAPGGTPTTPTTPTTTPTPTATTSTPVVPASSTPVVADLGETTPFASAASSTSSARSITSASSDSATRLPATGPATSTSVLLTVALMLLVLGSLLLAGSTRNARP